METSRDLEKNIWDENDYEQMGWHDSKIYAIAFDDDKFEIAFDIDYVIKWLNPKGDKANFKFWVAPTTLVFRNVWDLKISIESNLNLVIEDLQRMNAHAPKNAKHIPEAIEYDWIIQTTNGEITFKSVGYKQYFKKTPALLESQRIDFKQRGGISFEIKS